ncbi:MAG: hypothetical protein R3200_16755 [Xanthomonadales bacterium]|nr:hypothetical protein [Xanthomonadales bacterium]
MTYCLAIRVKQGIVFAADTRSNAGVDYVTSYRKLHTFPTADDRVIVLLSAGSLATSQAVRNWIRRDLEAKDGRDNLNSARYLFEVAEYVGRINRSVQEEHREELDRSSISGEASLILGGQINGDAPEIFLIYPQGNFIEASEDTPYLQSGENKYGKPILDRLITTDMDLELATRVAIISLDATISSNVTVAAPIDLAVYESDSLRTPRSARLDSSDPYFQRIRDQWQETIVAGLRDLPPFGWDSAETTPLKNG